METGLAQLRTLLSVIVLIAASVVAGAGFVGQAQRTDADMSIATHVQGDLMVTGWYSLHDNDCGCDSCPDCIHSGGPGCCAAGISTDECGVLHDAPDVVQFVAGKTFLATGIDPEALLQPPKIFA